MGYNGLLKEKLHAQLLRERGYSYKEILTKIHVSKDTISRWCRDIELTEVQKYRLVEKKIFGQKRGSIVAAERKKILRQERIKEIFTRAKERVGSFSKRDKFIAGIALYVAEGNKTDGQVGLANTDPRVISFMMDWFRTYCKVPEEKFRGAIWLHEGKSELKAKQFWSRVTKIPLRQFHKTYIAQNKTESRKVRKNIHEYGVFAIRFSKTETQREIMGWISAIFDATIQHEH